MTRRRRIVVTTTALVAVVILTAGGWFANEAQQAQRTLEQAASSGQLLQRAPTDGDTPAAERALADLQAAATQARSRTDGPLWSLAAHAPWAGDIVGAVQTVAGVVDDISSDALPPMVDVTGSLDLRAFSPSDGRLDVEALERLGPVIDSAGSVLRTAADDLDGIDEESLSGGVQRSSRGPPHPGGRRRTHHRNDRHGARRTPDDARQRG